MLRRFLILLGSVPTIVSLGATVMTFADPLVVTVNAFPVFNTSGLHCKLSPANSSAASYIGESMVVNETCAQCQFRALSTSTRFYFLSLSNDGGRHLSNAVALTVNGVVVLSCFLVN